MPVEDANAPPAGKAAEKKKAPPAKGAPGKAGALEEITDNRPREISYTRDLSEELNGVGLNIDEDIAHAFSNAFCNIQIVDVDRETQEESVVETIQLDLSCLLFPQGKLDVSTPI